MAHRSDLWPAVRARALQGAGRVRSALVPTLEAALAAGLAWLFAHYVLGHPMPFFAPVAAWICLGFSQDRDLRSAGEVALGVSLGVGLGDLLVHVIGSGVLQIMGVLVAAALIARFIDRARLVTIQAGVQAIVVVGLPANSSNPFGRWTDALAGGLIALLFVALFPHDVRRWPRAAARSTCSELGEILSELGRAIAANDAAGCHAALVRGRETQRLIDDWETANASARQRARVSPSGRRHRPELARLRRASTQIDRAIRNVRVICRRAEVMLEVSSALGKGAGDLGSAPPIADAVPQPGLSPAALESLGQASTVMAQAVRKLATALGAGTELTESREAVGEAAAALAPLRATPVGTQVVVDLMRSMLIDVARAAGIHAKDARAMLR